jgi:hypothetical protein
LAAGLPNGAWRLVPGARHVVSLTHPADVLAALAQVQPALPDATGGVRG